ncbi:MAG: MFS transporter [Candidatus Eremiobacteraeota bacterium]|nr:MFS transporter [Candidatus Eremiobacteraeota bacterium]
MFSRVLRFFATREDAPRIDAPERVKALYESKRTSVFYSLVLGYGFFYTTRLSLSVAKKPMVDAGVLELDQLGVIGACLLYTYAFGKFFNGFLADRANIARFLSTALLLSALVNLVFGMVDNFVTFAALWALNGWFQSIGSAPCVVSLCQWFSHKERGTRYGIWAGAHNIGEGLTFVGTSVFVSYWGWRWGFLGPGLVCVVVALVLSRTLADRPQTYGLPPVGEYRGDGSAGQAKKAPLKEMQLLVLKSPVVWILGLSSSFMYVTRYAIHSWGPLYLQTAKGYEQVEAGVLIGANTLMGLAGAACSGLLSDRFFNSRRNVPTLLYGLLLTGSLVALYLIPPGHRNLDLAALAAFEFAIGGLVVFLAGLTAVDLMPVRAAGAVKGTIGLMSYLGAATQDWVSGLLLKAGQSDAAGEVVINFDYAFCFWIGSSILSLILATFVWNVQPSD